MNELINETLLAEASSTGSVFTHRDSVASADIACIGNVGDEVTPLSQRFKCTTCSVAVLAHLQP